MPLLVVRPERDDAAGVEVDDDRERVSRCGEVRDHVVPKFHAGKTTPVVQT
jgi:hypothetical protein